MFVAMATDDGANIDVNEALARWREEYGSGFRAGKLSAETPRLGRRARSGQVLNPSTDDLDPSDRRKIEGILRRNGGVEGLPDMSPDDPHGANTVIPPLTVEQRIRDSRRELADGRPQTGGW
jgi:hypothetical protein